MESLLRRSTMAPVDGNTRSNIPVPSTVKKPQPAPRMSIMGLPGRSQQPVAAMSRSQNANPLLQSASKPNLGRTPLNSSTARRGSIWPGSAVPVASSSNLNKDPRPLRDKVYQGKMRSDIYEFLKREGVEITKSTLTNIQGKDYRIIFEYLLQNLDPSYPTDKPRFEDEFIPALKAIKYPFAHQLDNKWLAAPASMHSWPALLGVLHWMVEICKMKQIYLGSKHPTVQDPDDVPEEFDDRMHHLALAFELFETGYSSWLNCDEEFTQPRHVIEDRYSKKDEKLSAELEATNKQVEDTQNEYERLKCAAAPLAKLEKENSLLHVDSEKFKAIIHQLDKRTKKLEEQTVFEDVELKSKYKELEILQKELYDVKDRVQQQGLTQEEVLKMNSEHEQLSRAVEDLKQKITDAHRSSNKEEVNMANRAAATEETLETYLNLVASLGNTRPPAPYNEVDLNLELNPAVESPSQLLVGPDIRKMIKPALNAIAESKRSERADVESERIRIDNDLDLLTQECENIEEDVLTLDKRVNTLNEQAEKLRDAAQRDAHLASTEATRLERELATARSAALGVGMGVKSQLQGAQVSYSEQVAKVERLKDETVRAILQHSHDIVLFKDQVSKQLEELKDATEAQ